MLHEYLSTELNAKGLRGLRQQHESCGLYCLNFVVLMIHGFVVMELRLVLEVNSDYYRMELRNLDVAMTLNSGQVIYLYERQMKE